MRLFYSLRWALILCASNAAPAETIHYDDYDSVTIDDGNLPVSSPHCLDESLTSGNTKEFDPFKMNITSRCLGGQRYLGLFCLDFNCQEVCEEPVKPKPKEDWEGPRPFEYLIQRLVEQEDFDLKWVFLPLNYLKAWEYLDEMGNPYYTAILGHEEYDDGKYYTILITTVIPEHYHEILKTQVDQIIPTGATSQHDQAENVADETSSPLETPEEKEDLPQEKNLNESEHQETDQKNSELDSESNAANQEVDPSSQFDENNQKYANPENFNCKPIKINFLELQSLKHYLCLLGMSWDNSIQRCLPDPSGVAVYLPIERLRFDSHPEGSCEPGHVWNPQQRQCVDLGSSGSDQTYGWALQPR